MVEGHLHLPSPHVCMYVCVSFVQLRAAIKAQPRRTKNDSVSLSDMGRSREVMKLVLNPVVDNTPARVSVLYNGQE